MLQAALPSSSRNSSLFVAFPGGFVSIQSRDALRDQAADVLCERNLLARRIATVTAGTAQLDAHNSIESPSTAAYVQQMPLQELIDDLITICLHEQFADDVPIPFECRRSGCEIVTIRSFAQFQTAG